MRTKELTLKSHSNGGRTTLAARLLAVAGIALLCLAGCSPERGYHVILVADKIDYRPTMQWTEVREVMFQKPFTMRVFGADGKPVRLFAYATGMWRSLLERDEALLHISTPIIVENRHKALRLEIIDRNKSVTTRVVAIDRLKRIEGERHSRVLLIDLPPEPK
jgi:hypothetical protein